MLCPKCKINERKQYANNNKYHSYCPSCKLEYDRQNKNIQSVSKSNWRNKNKSWAKLCYTKSRAKKLGLDFNLELEDFNIPDVCPILGIPLYWGSGKLGANSPSIDRIDNKLGYVKGNVIIVSNKANTIKNNATYEELQQVATFYKNLFDKRKEI